MSRMFPCPAGKVSLPTLVSIYREEHEMLQHTRAEDAHQVINKRERQDLLRKIHDHPSSINYRVRYMTTSGIGNPMLRIVNTLRQKWRDPLLRALLTTAPGFGIKQFKQLLECPFFMEESFFPEKTRQGEVFSTVRGGFYGVDTPFGSWLRKLSTEKVFDIVNWLVEEATVKPYERADATHILTRYVQTAGKILQALAIPTGYVQFWMEVERFQMLGFDASHLFDEVTVYRQYARRYLSGALSVYDSYVRGDRKVDKRWKRHEHQPPGSRSLHTLPDL